MFLYVDGFQDFPATMMEISRCKTWDKSLALAELVFTPSIYMQKSNIINLIIYLTVPVYTSGWGEFNSILVQPVPSFCKRVHAETNNNNNNITPHFARVSNVKPWLSYLSRCPALSNGPSLDAVRLCSNVLALEWLPKGTGHTHLGTM